MRKVSSSSTILATGGAGECFATRSVVCGPTSIAPSRRDVLRIVLRVPLERQEIIIAAATAGKGPAGRGPRLIDRAAPFVRVEELADFAEMLVRLATHGVFLVFLRLRIFLLGFAEADTEMLGQPPDILLGQRDDGIRAAIAWTFCTIKQHWGVRIVDAQRSILFRQL